MVTHACSAYPLECCGVLLGHSPTASRAVAVENISPVPRSRYEIRPEDLLAASRLGLPLLGIYHSHLDGSADFSESDLANAWPWLVYVVISVRYGAVDCVKAWLPEGRPPKELTIDVPDQA